MAYDLVICGGGILGSSLAYWLSSEYDANILVLEKNDEVAKEQSGRNTGVLHRPFYLDPEKRGTFARAADWGYRLWDKVRREDGLPWRQVGTLELAVQEGGIEVLQRYQQWGRENGMGESELRFYGEEDVAKLRPNITAVSALYCRTDTSVDFAAFTRAMKQRAKRNGVSFRLGAGVERIERDRLTRVYTTDGSEIYANRFINTAGNYAVDIAHQCDAGLDYTDLNFRGDYWRVDPEFGINFPWNVYTVPSHPKHQFLDPHLVVRHDGTYDIGPSALFVPSADAYDFPQETSDLFSPTMIARYLARLARAPRRNKVNLVLDPKFRAIAQHEFAHMGKDGMIARMQAFMPTLSAEHISKRGVPGIRSTVINKDGKFEPEAILIQEGTTFHVLAYNSPGASGAPGFAAHMVGVMQQQGFLDGLQKRRIAKPLGNIDEIIESFR